MLNIFQGISLFCVIKLEVFVHSTLVMSGQHNLATSKGLQYINLGASQAQYGTTATLTCER